jgi:hypothetical protein
VIVLWSRASTKSNWVKEEAAEGRKRDILVPVLIEDVTIPLGFRSLQAAQLVGWSKDAESPEFSQLQEAVAEVLGTDHSRPTVSDKEVRSSTERSTLTRSQSPPPQKQHSTLLRFGAVIAILALFAVLGFLAGGFSAVFISDLVGNVNDMYGFLAAIPTWLAGLALAYFVWRRLGR